MAATFDPARMMHGLPPDLWLLVLRSFDLKSLCCLGATCRMGRSVAFRAELEQWKVIRIPKCTAKKAVAILRLGGAGCQQLDSSSYSQISDEVLNFAALHCKNLTVGRPPKL